MIGFEKDEIIFNIAYPNSKLMHAHFQQWTSFLLFVSICFVSSLQAQELPLAKPEAVGLSSERLKNLSDVFQAYATDKRMSGSVVLILRHGKVAYFNSFGKRDVESGAAMQNDVIFRIASQTKALTSVAIMILQEEGKLLITD